MNTTRTAGTSIWSCFLWEIRELKFEVIFARDMKGEMDFPTASLNKKTLWYPWGDVIGPGDFRNEGIDFRVLRDENISP